MLTEFITTFLISISPLGEARAGIPYGVMNDIPVGWAFLVGWLANLLVFPLFFYGIRFSNKTLWKSKAYKKGAVYLSKRAKKKTKSSIDKAALPTPSVPESRMPPGKVPNMASDTVPSMASDTVPNRTSATESTKCSMSRERESKSKMAVIRAICKHPVWRRFQQHQLKPIW